MQAYDQSESLGKITYGTISSFWNCVCEGGSWNGKSGAEAVFVYATKSQHATRQSQRLRRCHARWSRAFVRQNRRYGISLRLKISSLDGVPSYHGHDPVCDQLQTTVGHKREPCKNGWTDHDPIWETDSGWPKEPCERTATNFAAWWTEARRVWTVCLRLLPDSVAAAIWTRVQHANHSATVKIYWLIYQMVYGGHDSVVMQCLV